MINKTPFEDTMENIRVRIENLERIVKRIEKRLNLYKEKLIDGDFLAEEIKDINLELKANTSLLKKNFNNLKSDLKSIIIPMNDPILFKVADIMTYCKRLELGDCGSVECCDITEELEKLGFKRFAWSDIECTKENREECPKPQWVNDLSWLKRVYWKQLDEEIWVRVTEENDETRATHVLIINYIDGEYYLFTLLDEGNLGG